MDVMTFLEASTESLDTTSIFNSSSQYVTASQLGGVTNASLGYYGGNHTTRGMHIMEDAEKHRIIIICVIMAFTLIGNLTMIMVLLCKRSRRIKRVNILLVNLAIGDVAVALFVNSTEIFFIAFGDWTLGPLMCKVSVYVQLICLSSTTNLLTSMSIDRYQVIVKPMQSLAKRPRIWLKIAISWIISLILPIPQLFIFLQYNDGLKYDGTPKRICGSKGYTAQWQRKAYFTFTTVYILVIPISIMMYCYVKIIRVVWVRAKNESRRRPSCLIPPRPPATTPAPTAPPKQLSETYDKGGKGGVRCGCDGEAEMRLPVVSWAKSAKEKKDSNDNAEDKKKVMDFSEDMHPGSPRMSVRRSLVTASKRRALIMTLSVVISFLVCQLPYFIVTLIRIYSDYRVKLESLKIFSEFMVMVHSTLNPILYGLFTLRQYHLKFLFSILTCSNRASPTPGARASPSLGTRQSSLDERHQLLNSVRSKFTLRSNTCDSGIVSHTGSDKKGPKKSFRREKHPNQIASTTAVMVVSSSSSLSQPSSSSISILNKFKFKKLPPYSKKARAHFKGKQHKDTLLFANSDAITLKNKRRSKSIETEPSEVDISISPEYHQDFTESGALIANTHILKKNGSPTSSPTVGATANRSKTENKKHVFDMHSTFSEVDDSDKSIHWIPQDDEFIIGGLTRV